MSDYRNSILARILISLRKRRWLLATLFIISTVGACFIAWAMPKSYTTQALFQVKTKEASPLTSQLTKGLGMLDPLKKNSSIATMLAILESRELAMATIRKFDLMTKYDTKWEHLALKTFHRNFQVIPYAENIIGISFTYESQDSVKIIADSILAYADARNREIASSKAASDYAFLYAQMERIQSDIAAVADSMLAQMRKYNIVDLENQSKLGLEQLSLLEQEITRLGSRKAMMETENSGTPIQIQQLRNAISLLREKQRLLLSGSTLSAGEERFSFIAPYSALPDLQKKFKLYELEIEKNEGFLKILLPSLQEARTSMVENVPTLTFIDPTYRPPYKSKPKRSLVVILIVVPIMFLVCAFFVLKDFFRDPDYASDPGREFLQYIKANS